MSNLIDYIEKAVDNTVTYAEAHPWLTAAAIASLPFTAPVAAAAAGAVALEAAGVLPAVVIGEAAVMSTPAGPIIAAGIAAEVYGAMAGTSGGAALKAGAEGAALGGLAAQGAKAGLEGHLEKAKDTHMQPEAEKSSPLTGQVPNAGTQPSTQPSTRPSTDNGH